MKKHQLVVKYDWYDANTEMAGDEIGMAISGTGNYKKSNKTDLKYSTLGIGYNFLMNENVKFVFYYDMVTNETSTNLSGYSKDLKDNVFTLRLQYKF